MTTITIPRKMTKGEELVVIPRREYEKFLAIVQKDAVNEDDILRLAKEARRMKKAGKLPLLRSLKDLR